jgi:hypothetical protein
MFDDQVVPSEIPEKDLESDITATLKRLVEAGFSGFDSRLGIKKGSKQLDTATTQLCARQVRKIVDNGSHWQRELWKQSERPAAQNVGAIESEGDGRPRT